MSLNYIDLFAGAGGLSEGFIRAGFEPVAHVEVDRAACFTLKTRTVYHYLKSVNKTEIYISYLKGDISREKLYSYLPEDLSNSIINLSIGKENNHRIHEKIDNCKGNKEIDLIIGGPPCQAYSLIGRARSKDGMRGDHRNYLYVDYALFLEKYQPKVFVFENVIGLKSAGKGIYMQNMQKLFDKKGYSIKLFVVEANHFGVLQNRKRIIIVGWRKDMNPVVPDLEAICIETGNKVKDLLFDLPEITAGQGNDKFMYYTCKTNEYLNSKYIRNGLGIVTQHIARPQSEQDREIYRIAVEKWNHNRERLQYDELPQRLITHKNIRTFKDRFKVVAPDEPFSQTIVAHIAKDGHYYIHPDSKQNRSLSVREAARLQSFPDDYYFEGIKENGFRTAAFKQIGNAVPPLMAYEIANEIKKMLWKKI